MTVNEKELLNIIRSTNNPEQALLTAAQIILEFLLQYGSDQGHTPGDPRESA